MNANIAMSLQRADELFRDLRAEYEQSLQAKAVSERAIHYTHEVAERLRSVLDRLARLYWERHVKPNLSAEDVERASVYFPITDSEQSFASVMGRWRWKDIREEHESIAQYFAALQPYTSGNNRWLGTLNALALQSKHIDLVPQTRVEEGRVTVSGENGSVSWNPSAVKFGSGVQIMGTPVNPLTQRIVPAPHLTEKIERWVSFHIEGYGVDALTFAAKACEDVRKIALEMSERFGL